MYDQPSCGASAVTKIGLEKTKKHLKGVLGANASSLVPDGKREPVSPFRQCSGPPARRQTCKAEPTMPVPVETTILPPPELPLPRAQVSRPVLPNATALIPL